ncbi:UDP-N-acetylmuramoyl-L-alanyl-D-glutamate--2,6-diaminopimelate ligase [Anaerotruncus colihominis]|uniref:UDP-N-acetylmuramoyl-L-alanyl-D-glutamate--2, 6-diaminopimelate ligase n=1 Tax=Anaerotruncus colihominis TaxID=169435 RepID=UPI00242F540D|nr:UDP-N-acetylmuramoyl-L-alanyl-D-glutamate--2,6-diaminopimelate ligase [Anaerotruncus colihominis]
MRLYELLDGLDAARPDRDCEITGVTSDSRQVEPGTLFVCIRGTRADGHDYAVKAAEAGAAAILCERAIGLENEIVCRDTHYAYGIVCGNWYGNPARRLRLVGVTGTNGKTTVSYMVKHILESAGHQTGLIGTIHNEIGDITLPARHTTPDPLALHGMLARMADAGCEYVVMECSSHALDQQRLAGLRFASVGFTNLTQDHLDYHGDMESYYHAKKKLFSMCDAAAINMDDAYGERLAAEVRHICPVTTFSTVSDAADFTAKDIRPAPDSSRFMIVGKGAIARVRLPIPGDFSVANAMTAAVMCMALGLTLEQAAQGLNTCQGVVGRIEVLPTGTDYVVIRDYAHSPDGLEKIITTMKKFARGRVVTLFGCAGNRDRTKRKKMAEIVARLSDFVILTSDNPRDEDEMQIIEDAKPGLLEHPDTPYEIIPDRYAAIEWALGHAKKDDVLILAGKGHEDYQVLHGETICFDERQIVLELLEKKKGS